MRSCLSRLSNSTAWARSSATGWRARRVDDQSSSSRSASGAGPGHPVEQRVRRIEQLAGGHDLIDQAAAQASCGVEVPAGEQDLLGDGRADQLGQPPAGAGRGQDARARAPGCRRPRSAMAMRMSQA